MSSLVSLIPLALLGGIVRYVVWKTRAAESDG
jgi:MFS superfamily sulfate permease-like transporter